MTEAIIEELSREARRIESSPNRKRADELRAIADKEAKRIEERIAAAIRLREAF
jgi:hypothetical protein